MMRLRSASLMYIISKFGSCLKAYKKNQNNHRFFAQKLSYLVHSTQAIHHRSFSSHSTTVLITSNQNQKRIKVENYVKASKIQLANSGHTLYSPSIQLSQQSKAEKKSKTK